MKHRPPVARVPNGSVPNQDKLPVDSNTDPASGVSAPQPVGATTFPSARPGSIPADAAVPADLEGQVPQPRSLEETVAAWSAVEPGAPMERVVVDAPGAGGHRMSVASRVVVPATFVLVVPTLGALVGVALAGVGGWFVAAGAVTATLGMAGGALGVRNLLRRIENEVDAPLDALRDTVGRISRGDDSARVSWREPTPLTSLLDALDDLLSSASGDRERLSRKAEWGDQSRMIFEALELADTEAQVYAVVGNALALIDAGQPAELLMAAKGSQRLRAVAENPMAESPACPVETLDDCLAIRRGQVVVTDSSEAINACPMLRGRPGGPCSAVCVPVTVAGQPVGIFHAVGEERHPPDAEVADRLAALGGQVGTRIGALRLLESSREEAATDGLTGLPNRRVLEAQLSDLLDTGVEFVMVMADLDKFKKLNDTYGHEMGDKALQLFARVMQDNIRGHDLVARVGGEEFVVVYPDMSVLRSIEAIERLRGALSSALAVGGVQPFTCSFGVTHSSIGTTPLEILRIADAGLLRAKELGGDQVVYADEMLAVEVFGSEAR